MSSETLISDVKKFVTGKPNWSGAPLEKRRSHWRYNEESGRYNNAPVDPNYFNKYLSVKVVCECCGKTVTRGNLSKHKQRDICLKRRSATTK